jgi:hypothetical protein
MQLVLKIPFWTFFLAGRSPRSLTLEEAISLSLPASFQNNPINESKMEPTQNQNIEIRPSFQNNPINESKMEPTQNQNAGRPNWPFKFIARKMSSLFVVIPPAGFCDTKDKAEEVKPKNLTPSQRLTSPFSRKGFDNI